MFSEAFLFHSIYFLFFGLFFEWFYPLDCHLLIKFSALY